MMPRFNVSTLFALFLTFCSIALFAPNTSAKTITWNLALSVITPNSTYQWMTETELPFRIEKATRGKLKIVTHKGMVKPADVLDAVRDRRVDMGIQGSMYRGDTALLNYVALPVILPYEALPEIHHKVQPILQEAMQEEFGVVMLGQGYWSKQSLCSNRPANTFEDLKGLKFRSSSHNLTKLMKEAGGAPVAMPHAEVYLALQRGVIDGAQSSLASIMGKKWFEVGKYLNWWPIGNVAYYFIVNKDAWNELPEDLQKIVMKTVSDLGLETWGGSYIDDVNNRKKATTPSYGLTNLYPSQEDIDKMGTMVEPVIEDWKKRAGPRSEQIMAIINEELGTNY